MPTTRSANDSEPFSALAFKTHPDPFLRIPLSRAMEQKERTTLGAVTGSVRRVTRSAARRLAVLFVELLDASSRELQQRRVLRQHFLVRVLKIRQQAEVQVGVPIGQESHL